jgi:hypothetical protein
MDDDMALTNDNHAEKRTSYLRGDSNSIKNPPDIDRVRLYETIRLWLAWTLGYPVFLVAVYEMLDKLGYHWY